MCWNFDTNKFRFGHTFWYYRDFPGLSNCRIRQNYGNELWVPSQNGMFLECLQAHHATVFASVISISFGSSPVPLCEPSQNG